MATFSQRQVCIRCRKTLGSISCTGYHKCFCEQHFRGHQTDLTREIENIHQEYDQLQSRGEQTCSDNISQIISCIDAWERKSIQRIRQVAEENRAQTKKYFQQRLDALNVSLTSLRKEIQTSREMDNFTELELKKWMEQLNSLRNGLKTSSTTKLRNENADQSTTICLIDFETDSHLSPSISSQKQMILDKHPLVPNSISERSRNCINNRNGKERRPYLLHCLCDGFDDFDDSE